MPRVIRVGDIDDDITHPGDIGPNRMVENNCNVFANGGGSASLALASALGSSAPLDIPKADAEALLSEVQNDAALIRNGGTRATAGGDSNVPFGPGISLQSNEYAEQFSGEGAGGAPASGTSDGLPGNPNATATPGATPTGQGQAGPNFNNYPPVPDDDLLQFSVYATEGRQIDPGAVNIASSMARAVSRRLTVNSGYRSGAYNGSLRGAAQNSNHMYGLAMDISTSGLSDAEKQRMLIAAIENGAGGVGIYNTFIHIDIESKRTWGSHPSWAIGIMRSAGYIA